MRRADLHLHSTFSDGVLRPELLVEECAEAGVTLMAVTDHDTFDGSDSLLGQTTAVPVIPGVELSMRDMRGLHLLGYGLAPAAELRATVKQLAINRSRRADQMLQKLEELGMPLDHEELHRRCHGTIGRPHIARCMVHHGYVSCMQEAFEKYLGHGKPAYVAGERLSITEAIPLLRRNGFVPVLAHPCELKMDLTVLEPLIHSWKELGLLGMEVYHPSAASIGYELVDHAARRLGLLVTGGSDFHQANDKHGRIGSTSEAWHSIEDDIAALMDTMRAMQ